MSWFLLGQVDITAREEPQSTSQAGDKDLWKSVNASIFTFTVSQSLSWMGKTKNVK